MTLAPAGPLDVVDVLRAERAALLELLRSLTSSDWERPTECPTYDVQGVAAHLLGDDLSLLSRQRDSAAPGLIRFLEDGRDFRSALDHFNDTWVDTVQFFSPTLLVAMLEVAGRWTADWYAAVDPASPGEPVGFFGATGPSPYWQIAAREYVERWVHHHQIRRALRSRADTRAIGQAQHNDLRRRRTSEARRPDLSAHPLGLADLDDDTFLGPAAAAVIRGVVSHLDDLGVADAVSVVLSVEGLAAWTLQRDGDRWILFDGRTDDWTAELTLGRSHATPVFSRGLAADAVTAAFSLAGDAALGHRIVAAIALLAGR